MKWLKKVAATPLDNIAKVIDSLVEATGDRTNAPSIHAVRGGLNDVWQNVYPVGAIYMSVNDVNPSTIFGGTWNRIKDRFLLASGDTYESGVTGGNATQTFTPDGTVGGHALTVPELPKHIHLYAPYYPTDSGVGADFYHVASGSDIDIPKVKKNIADYEDWTVENIFREGTKNPSKTEAAANEEHDHNFTGAEMTLNTMPPYLTVNVWVRVA